MNIFKSTVGWLLLLSFIVSCSSTTLVRSSDSAAKIYVDGEYRGKGTVSHSDKKIVGSTTVVKIQKDGCEPSIYTFSKNEKFNVGACIGGILVLFPFLWIMKYNPEHLFEYKCTPQL